jgi:hypothetical protein
MALEVLAHIATLRLAHCRRRDRAFANGLRELGPALVAAGFRSFHRPVMPRAMRARHASKTGFRRPSTRVVAGIRYPIALIISPDGPPMIDFPDVGKIQISIASDARTIARPSVYFTSQLADFATGTPPGADTWAAGRVSSCVNWSGDISARGLQGGRKGAVLARDRERCQLEGFGLSLELLDGLQA